MNCPECKNPALMARAEGHDTTLVCGNKLPNGKKCGYAYTDEQAEQTLGIKKVPAFIDGQWVASYENVGEKWDLFPSPYCLKFFKTYEERINHDKQYHKLGDPMACCIPSGFNTIISICGDENTV